MRKILGKLTLLIASISVILLFGSLNCSNESIKANELIDYHKIISEETSEVTQQALEEFIEVSKDVILKDLSIMGNSGTDKVTVQNHSALTGESFESVLDEELTAFYVQYREDEDLAELYFLFDNDELIYMSLFNYVLYTPFSAEVEQHRLTSLGLVNYGGQRSITYQLQGGANVNQLSLFQYTDITNQSQLIQRMDYFDAIHNGHIKQLINLSNTQQADNDLLDKLINITASNSEETDLEEDEEDIALDDISQEEAEERLKLQFAGLDFLNHENVSESVHSLSQEQKQGNDISYTDIINSIGNPHEEMNTADNTVLTYYTKESGYYIHKFILVDGNLAELITEYHNTSLFDSFSQLQMEQVEQIAEQSYVAEFEVFAILNHPWQIIEDFYNKQTHYIWMKYPESNIEFIMFTIDETSNELSIHYDEE